MSVTRLTTAAGAQEPVSVTDLQGYGRIVGFSEALVMERLLIAARNEVERYSGHELIPGTFRVSFDEWLPWLELPITPISAVTSVTYQYDSGISEVVDALAYYVDLTSTPPRIAFGAYGSEPWLLRSSAGVEVVVTGGYTTPSDVPEDIKQHIITAALLMFEHRDDPELLGRVRRYIGTGCSSFGMATL